MQIHDVTMNRMFRSTLYAQNKETVNCQTLECEAFLIFKKISLRTNTCCFYILLWIIFHAPAAYDNENEIEEKIHSTVYA